MATKKSIKVKTNENFIRFHVDLEVYYISSSTNWAHFYFDSSYKFHFETQEGDSILPFNVTMLLHDCYQNISRPYENSLEQQITEDFITGHFKRKEIAEKYCISIDEVNSALKMTCTFFNKMLLR